MDEKYEKNIGGIYTDTYIYIFLIKIYSKAICKKKGGRGKEKAHAEYRSSASSIVRSFAFRCNFSEIYKLRNDFRFFNSILSFIRKTKKNTEKIDELSRILPFLQIFLKDACNKSKMSMSGESISLSTDSAK